MNENRKERRLKVLVIDDSSFIRRLTRAIFEDLGFEVSTAEDGPEGARLGLEGPFDVVVVDGVLPGLSGPEVCRQLSSLPPERRPIIILQSISMKGYTARSQALSAGADAYFEKEALSTSMVAWVRETLTARELAASAA
ncbi:MAG: response regulator [Thermoanaerobaculia bacterium]